MSKRSSKRPEGDPAVKPEPARVPETHVRATVIAEELLKQTPRNDPRFGLLELLYHQLQVDESQFEEAQQLIEEYSKAYEKLTAPANRIATYLGSPERGMAHIAVGDAEYLTNVDPHLEDATLEVGTRVKVNDAFALLDDLGYPPQGQIVKLAEVLDEQRLRVSSDAQGTGGRVVTRCPALEQTKLKVGDELRLDPTSRVALEYFEQREVKDYYLEEVPETPWSAVGGQEQAIQLIKDTIERPLLHPDLYERFGKRPLKGILLYGPPGCGKTLIGKATAYNLTQTYAKHLGKDVEHYFMLINGPRLLNMWLGETERMVRELFSQARQRAKEGYLVFIFIDEADSLLRTRSSGRFLNIANTVVPQFAAEMDGLVQMRNVVVMLTSNRPDYIDPAILRPERIDRKVKVNRPNREAIKAIFAIYLDPKVPLDPGWIAQHEDEPGARLALVDEATDYLCAKTPQTAFLDVALRSGRHETLYWKDLSSGALIASSVERAKDRAIQRAIATKAADAGLSLEDVRSAIAQEYAENEIFPKTDNLEDWLKLLDHEPENVIEIQPARQRRGKDRFEAVI